MVALSLDRDVLTGLVVGDVIVPGDLDYDIVRKTAMARFDDIRPAAVVRCRAPEDASAVIRFARRAKLPVAVRCGGHSVAGRSFTDGIVIDVTPMRGVSVSEGIATIGAGLRLGELYEALYEHRVTIPAGCGPSVGIAGLTLGGGIGILGRRYGLTCDRLRRAHIVLADGRSIECDEEQDADLFWALRGAGGGNFGVVTSLAFETVPAADATVFHLRWSFMDAVALVETWQEWAPTAPDDVDATLRLSAGPRGDTAQVELIGAVIGSEADAAARLDVFISSAGRNPASAWSGQMTYPAAKRQLNDLDQNVESLSPEADHKGYLYTKSEFFRQSLDRRTIKALVDNLARDAAGVLNREVAFMPWGGAYNEVASDASAFPHRNERFLVQHLVDTDPDSQLEAGRGWLSRSWDLLHPFGSGGVYPNFPDPDLPDSGRAYYAENYDRLRKVKTRYDPDNFFSFHQSLPSTR